MCQPSDLLCEVIERLTYPGVRRMVIVEGGTRKLGGIHILWKQDIQSEYLPNCCIILLEISTQRAQPEYPANPKTISRYIYVLVYENSRSTGWVSARKIYPVLQRVMDIFYKLWDSITTRKSSYCDFVVQNKKRIRTCYERVTEELLY